MEQSNQNGTVKSNYRLILLHAGISVFMNKKRPEKIYMSKYFHFLFKDN